MKLKHLRIFAISVISLIVIAIFCLHSLPFAKSQPEAPLPVILIHGYRQDESVWDTWKQLLEDDSVSYLSVTFHQSDDDCGSAADHSMELNNIVLDVLRQTGHDQVNIVGHSKGGLDARLYLQGGTDNVANLIMIGTPNAGSPLADIYNDTECLPAALDLKPSSAATKALQNVNTDYYTIAGDWIWWWFLIPVEGNLQIDGPDDGLVPVSSVESKSYFHPLGQTPHTHNLLLGSQEYQLARDILVK
jgi:pimeloyl-ACP methyl ester carboxylesterase